MAGFMDDYESVDDRIHAFYGAHPKGRILTTLAEYSDTHIVFEARVWRENLSEDKPDSTGFAEERRGSSKINQSYPLENAETSAIGRALANLGFSAKGKRPSKQEMEKTKREAPAEKVTSIDKARKVGSARAILSGDERLTSDLMEEIKAASDEVKDRVRELLSAEGLSNPLPAAILAGQYTAIKAILKS